MPGLGHLCSWVIAFAQIRIAELEGEAKGANEVAKLRFEIELERVRAIIRDFTVVSAGG